MSELWKRAGGCGRAIERCEDGGAFFSSIRGVLRFNLRCPAGHQWWAPNPEAFMGRECCHAEPPAPIAPIRKPRKADQPPRGLSFIADALIKAA